MNEKDLEIHVRVVLDKEFIEKHSFEDCWDALKTEIEIAEKEIRSQALSELEKFKPRDVKS